MLSPDLGESRRCNFIEQAESIIGCVKTMFTSAISNPNYFILARCEFTTSASALDDAHIRPT